MSIQNFVQIGLVVYEKSGTERHRQRWFRLNPDPIKILDSFLYSLGQGEKGGYKQIRKAKNKLLKGRGWRQTDYKIAILINLCPPVK